MPAVWPASLPQRMLAPGYDEQPPMYLNNGVVAQYIRRKPDEPGKYVTDFPIAEPSLVGDYKPENSHADAGPVP